MEPTVRLLFLLDHPLLDLDGLVAPFAQLGFELGPQLDGLLTRLDLRLASRRIRRALGLVEHEVPVRRAASSRDPVAKRSPARVATAPTTSPITTPRTTCMGSPAGSRPHGARRRSARAPARGCAPPRYQLRFVALVGRSGRVRLSWIRGSRRVGDRLEQATCRKNDNFGLRPQPTDQAPSGATSGPAAAATDSWSKPRRTSSANVLRPEPCLDTSAAARSPSGSSAAIAAVTSCGPTPRPSRSCRIASSPYPRAASDRARDSAKRASST